MPSDKKHDSVADYTLHIIILAEQWWLEKSEFDPKDRIVGLQQHNMRWRTAIKERWS